MTPRRLPGRAAAVVPALLFLSRSAPAGAFAPSASRRRRLPAATAIGHPFDALPLTVARADADDGSWFEEEAGPISSGGEQSYGHDQVLAWEDDEEEAGWDEQGDEGEVEEALPPMPTTTAHFFSQKAWADLNPPPSAPVAFEIDDVLDGGKPSKIQVRASADSCCPRLPMLRPMLRCVCRWHHHHARRRRAAALPSAAAAARRHYDC